MFPGDGACFYAMGDIGATGYPGSPAPYQKKSGHLGTVLDFVTLREHEGQVLK
jgi:hypothetical protein